MRERREKKKKKVDPLDLDGGEELFLFQPDSPPPRRFSFPRNIALEPSKAPCSSQFQKTVNSRPHVTALTNKKTSCLVSLCSRSSAVALTFCFRFFLSGISTSIPAAPKNTPRVPKMTA